MYTFVENFRGTSPYAEMVPSASDFALHPFRSLRDLSMAIYLTEAKRSAEVVERRRQKVDDVAKRNLYRKAHGIEPKGFGGWSDKDIANALSTVVPAEEESAEKNAEAEERRKKFLGIF